MSSLAVFTSLPRVGGHTTITLGLARLCAPMFDDVLVIAKEIPKHGTSDVALAELQDAGVTTALFRGGGASEALRSLSYLSSGRWHRPDAFLALGMRHLSPVLELALRPRRSVYYHIIHEIGPRTNRMLQVYSRFFDVVAFISPATERAWKNASGSKTATLSVTQPSELKLELRERPQSDDPIRFGFIGRLNEGKGCRVLVRFAASASAPCSLRIAGAGEPEIVEAFRRLGSQVGRSVNVVFDGPFSPADRCDYLGRFFSDIDYLIVPSQDDLEGIPTVMLEALQAGVPVVATRTGGMRAFDYPDYGWPEARCVTLVDRDDVYAALEMLARRPRPSCSLAAACRKYYEMRFSDRALRDAWRRTLTGSAA